MFDLINCMLLTIVTVLLTIFDRVLYTYSDSDLEIFKGAVIFDVITIASWSALVWFIFEHQ